MANKKQKKLIGLSLATLFVATGIFNTVVISSESHLDEKAVRFVKRLDEMNGVTVQGRSVAATKWEKLSLPKAEIVKNKVEQSESAPVAYAQETESFVQDQLNLALIEVIDPKNTSAVQAFSGNLVAQNGVIEELNVSLPNGESIGVAFTELTGNVFEYDLNGEKFAGMMYQVDQHAYMVTFTNGPFEGTRLRFSSQDPLEQQIQIENTLADNNIHVGNFGDSTSVDAHVNHAAPTETAQSQGFNFDQTVI